MRQNNGTFTVDGLGEYPGYWGGHTWNGWVTPLFDKEMADRILADYCAQRGCSGRYDPENDTYVLEFEGEQNEEDVKGDEGWYGIGSFSWAWETVETKGDN